MVKALPDAWPWAAWLGPALLPMGGGLLFIDYLSERHLAQDAQHSTQTLARHVAVTALQAWRCAACWV